MAQERSSIRERLAELRRAAGRFVRVAGGIAWALAGVAAYSAILLYMGWRVGVVDGAPLGGPVCEQAEPRQ
jgi:hypothetical protein